MVARSNSNDSPSDRPDGYRGGHLTEERTTILSCVRELDGPTSLFELAAALRDRVDRGTPETAGTEREGPDRRLVRLHHVDLPLLDDAGFLEYDYRSNVVTPVPERYR